MNLREEILKNSGLLTEMPIVKKRSMTVACYASTGWYFSIDNNQKTLDADNLNDKNVFNYITTGKVNWYKNNQKENIDDTNGFIEALKKPSVKVVIYDNKFDVDYGNIFIGNKAKAILRNLIKQLGVDKLTNPSDYDFEDKGKPTYESNLKTIHTLIKNM